MRRLFLFLSIISILVPLNLFPEKFDRPKAKALVEKGISLNNNSDQELRFYQQAIELDPTYGAAYYNMANIFFDKAQYKKAIPLYEKACQYQSGDNDFRFNLALAYFKDRDPIQALLNINQIVKKAPGDLEALFFQSKIYTSTESFTNLNAARKNMLRIIQTTKSSALQEKSKALLLRIEKKLGLK